VKEGKASSGFEFDLDLVDIGHKTIKEGGLSPGIKNGKHQLNGDGGGNPMEEFSISKAIGLPLLNDCPQLGDVFP
jgi:hypothetical protein